MLGEWEIHGADRLYGRAGLHGLASVLAVSRKNSFFA